MTPEALDFKAECDQIHALLNDKDDSIFDQITLFKSWTVGDVIRHLHLWNIAADLSLNDPGAFSDFIGHTMSQMGAGLSHVQFQTAYFEGQTSADVFKTWATYFPAMSDRFYKSDPDKRVKWAGPDMSVRSSIIARQMEHWAHAQAVFDVLGVDRVNTDRIKNVAHIGVTTFSWSFRVRGITPPTPKPFVKLTAPSGKIWTWNEEQADNCVEGSAVEFAQVVTQCRNVNDTRLSMTGDIAKDWMANAQCFAGVPETPPAKGTRHKVSA
ncbi:MAG: TIGR03084 family metal-binding protein [Litorimonas sp.]